MGIITVTKINLSTPPSTNQEVNIKFRLTSDPDIASSYTNLGDYTIKPNGDLVTPLVIDEVEGGNTYTIWATMLCSNSSATLNVLVPDAPPVPTCPDRVLVFQICNSNSVIDDNFEVFLNNISIGTVDLNANAQVGSVFIASLSTPSITAPDFVCPLVDMDVFYFDPAIVVGGVNVIKMTNIQNNGSGNQGSVGIRNYLIDGSDLIDPCVVADLDYSGASGANFTLPFNYTECCPDDE